MKFLTQFYPFKKTTKLRDKITTFAQNHGEDIYQVWKPFKQLLNSFPYHMHTNEEFSHTFFEGLEHNTRALLNSAVGGQALSITREEFLNLLDKLSEENQGYEGDISRNTTQQTAWILDVEQAIALNAKIDAMQDNMTLKFNHLALNQASVNVVLQTATWCGVCGI